MLVCLVIKKDGILRFCFDFRKLNIIKKDVYLLLRIDDVLDKLVGNKIFYLISVFVILMILEFLVKILKMFREICILFLVNFVMWV